MGERSRAGGLLRRSSGGDQRALGAVTNLADLLGGESDRSRRFLGGLVAGALAGAALAGTTMVRRRAAERTRDRHRGG